MHNIEVSIVYATKTKQWIYETTVARGTSARELLDLSGFVADIPDLGNKPADQLKLGIYAQPIEHDHLLQSGDRVEVYRPLLADPKEVRRQLALVGKTMGKG